MISTIDGLQPFCLRSYILGRLRRNVEVPPDVLSQLFGLWCWHVEGLDARRQASFPKDRTEKRGFRFLERQHPTLQVYCAQTETC